MQELEKGQRAKVTAIISAVRTVEINCKILWIEPDRVGLSFPKLKSDSAQFFYEGKEIEAIVYTDKGIYVFDSMVIDSPYEYEFIIELPEEKQKIQRREYVRVPLNCEFVLSFENEKYFTETINMGGGGVRLNSDFEFEINSTWGFLLKLPKWREHIKGYCKILYTYKNGNNFISAVKFIDIDEISRNKLIKLCFEEEANLLKLRYNKTEGYL